MSDDELTRKYNPGPEQQNTRLVRRPATVDGDESPGGDQPRTRIAGRPSRPRQEGEVPAADSAADNAADNNERPVVGWLVVVGGPGRGKFAPIFDGLNSVGRAEDQSARLDFGDDAISRSDHAYIAYDHIGRNFKIQMGGKANLVRLNKVPVLQPVDIKTGDRISIGNTELAFVSFCGEHFDWQESQT